MLTWRVVTGDKEAGRQQLSEMVSDWMDALQVRVPGVRVLLVATHVDLAPAPEVDEQIAWVQQMVQERLHAMHTAEKACGVPALEVLQQGKSFPVNCLDGNGIALLRAELIRFARELPLWAEPIPTEVVKLQAEILIESRSRAWLSLQDFVELASRCGLAPGDPLLGIAVRSLHERSVFKYFGNIDDALKRIQRGEALARIIDDTVFIEPTWIIDALKGLIRHDRTSLLFFFSRCQDPQQRTWLRRVHRLATYGVLHVELLPFLWPGGTSQLSKEYWTWARQQDKEGAMWKADVAASDEGYQKVVALLEGCDIMRKVSGQEYVVPALLAQRDSLDARAFSAPVDMVSSRVPYRDVPPGFFERLLVLCRKDYSHMDFSDTTAAFYGHGLKAQLFLSRDRVVTADQGSIPVVNLQVFTSTKKQGEKILNYLKQLYLFFRGMVCVDGEGQLQRSGNFSHTLEFGGKPITYGDAPTEPVQVHTLETDQPLGLTWEDMGSCRPASGAEIKNAALAGALRDKAAFRMAEFHEFGVPDLSVDSFIQADSGNFFKPQSSMSARIKAILQSDPRGKELTVKCSGKPECEAEWGDEYVRRLRVVVVCVDEHIASDNTALQQLQAAEKAGLVIIPVICPGFEISDYSCWWPASMSGLKRHSLFVDLRNLNNLESKVLQELLPQIIKFLEEWRGQAPDPSVFKEAADRIVCVQCVKQSIAKPHFFSRAACEAELETRSAEINRKATEGVGESDVSAAKELRDALLTTKCDHGHVVGLQEDVLQKSVIFEAVPCPSCVESGQVPPHCFSRRKLLHKFSEEELNKGRMGSVECPVCEAAGRPKTLKILDVVVPEVFASYNWGRQQSTQAIVRAMRTRIEEDASVVCWFDIGGGMGAGQSHLEEMEEGIRKCTVVVIFISDAYCKSANCVREFLHASRHSKFLIVVLVPDSGPVCDNGPSSGWTGPGPEDKNWWEHAAKLSTCKDPDNPDKTFSWSTLAQFEPIDLRVSTDTLKKERVLETSTLEIITRVQARFHRGEHIRHTDTMYTYWRKRAVLDSFSASALAGDQEKMKREAVALFERLDLNEDKLIDRSELLWAFPQLEDKTADLMIEETDTDGDGRISFDEMWAMVQRLATATSDHPNATP